MMMFAAEKHRPLRLAIAGVALLGGIAAAALLCALLGGIAAAALL